MMRLRFYLSHFSLLVRAWYAAQIAHFTPDGVDFWWNDEGETLYFTFNDWNVAQVASLASQDPKRRFFTINRCVTRSQGNGFCIFFLLFFKKN